MEARIVCFRRGRHTQNTRHFIIKVDNGGKEFLGKFVVWKSPSGKTIKGKIVSFHGKQKNKFRVIFEKGLPGTAIMEKVDILWEE